MMNPSPENIKIRAAVDSDIPGLYRLYETIGKKDAGYFESCLHEGQREVFIVSCHGEDAGFCVLNWKPKYRFYEVQNIPEIQDLNVVPVMRRKGLAQALINFCEQRARQKGCTQIGISVGLTPDYGPAQILYARAGYIPDGQGITYDRQPVQHGDKHPVDDDLCLMMVKRLHSG